MEWQSWLVVIFGILLILMATGMPIALCFFVINVIGMYFLFGGMMGLQNLINSLYNSLNSFILLPIPLFILMGEVMFQSKIAPTLIHVLGKWMGKLPGRLALLAVASGTLFSTLTGTSIASVAMLGSTLVPEMEAQGYKKSMTSRSDHGQWRPRHVDPAERAGCAVRRDRRNIDQQNPDRDHRSRLGRRCDHGRLYYLPVYAPAGDSLRYTTWRKSLFRRKFWIR